MAVLLIRRKEGIKMIYGNDTKNKDIIGGNNGGVSVLQYPYKYSDLPTVTQNIKNIEDLERVTETINAEVMAVFNEHHDTKTLKTDDTFIRYVDSRQAPYELAFFAYGDDLFRIDYRRHKAEVHKQNNPVLSKLMENNYIHCGIDCVFVVPSERDRLLLIYEGIEEDDTQECGSQALIEVTECVYKAIKGKCHIDNKKSFKGFLGELYSVSNNDSRVMCRYLENYIAKALWGFENGNGAVTVKTVTNAEKLF